MYKPGMFTEHTCSSSVHLGQLCTVTCVCTIHWMPSSKLVVCISVMWIPCIHVLWYHVLHAHSIIILKGVWERILQYTSSMQTTNWGHALPSTLGCLRYTEDYCVQEHSSLSAKVQSFNWDNASQTLLSYWETSICCVQVQVAPWTAAKGWM